MGGRIHITWADGEEYGSDRDVCYTMIDTSGDTITTIEPEMIVMDGDSDHIPCCWWYSSSRHPEIFVLKDRVYITFNVCTGSGGGGDSVGDGFDIFSFKPLQEEGSDIYLAILDVTVPPSSLTFPAGFTNGITVGASAGDIFTFQVNYLGYGPPQQAELWIDLNGDGSYASASYIIGAPILPFSGTGLAGILVLSAMGMISILVVLMNRKRKPVYLGALLLTVILVAAAGLTGCGGEGGVVTPEGQERITMTEVDQSDIFYADGKLYTASVTIGSAGTYSYKFVFTDEEGVDCIGDPAIGQTVTVP